MITERRPSAPGRVPPSLHAVKDRTMGAVKGWVVVRGVGRGGEVNRWDRILRQ